MKDDTEKSYTERFIPVSDLEVDPRVQRGGLNKAKITDMVKNWNPSAKGLIHVSERKNRALILLDGMHRTEAERIVSSNTGEMWSRVFTGLTLAEEVQMFLDLNRTTQPTLIDKFNVLLNGNSPDAAAAQHIQRLANQRGWTVARTAGPGHINAVKVLQRVYDISVRNDREPNLLELTLLVITEAWGTNDRTAVEGSLLEGIAAMFDEYGSSMDIDRLTMVLRETAGGPTGLLAKAQQMAKINGGKRSMAVADVLVTAYNRGLTKRRIPAWRKR